MLILKVNYFQKRVDTSLFFFLKNSVYYRNPLLIGFFVFIISATLIFPARAEISFTESTQEAGLTYTGPTWGAQWADYNGDGWPDIWVTNHQSKEPSLYLNMGDGTFDEISDSIWNQKPSPNVDTHGAGWADFDNDGDQDILVNGGTSRDSNLFFVNDNGILYESAEAYGVSFTENRGRMPLWLDFDNDGLLDVYLNGIVPPYLEFAALFQQDKQTGFFDKVNSLVGFEDHGALFSMLADLTGDGVLDIITYDGGAGFPRYVYSMATIPFTEHRNQIFPSDTGYASDAAFADFNGDLRQDLYLSRSGGGDQVNVTSHNVAAAIITNNCGCEKGITFKSNGTVRILFSLPNAFQNYPIYVGSSGLPFEIFSADISPDDPRIWGFWPRIPVYIELDPKDPRVSGMASHQPGVDNGVYVGFDKGANEWRIVSSRSVDQSFESRFIVETDNPITDYDLLNFNRPQPAIDTLYIHDGAQLKEIPAQQSGINKHLRGRSVVAGDFDNDMDIDIYVVNSLKVLNTPNILFENDGTGAFTEVTDTGGAAGTSLGAGDHVIAADYNRDGFLDLFVTNGKYPSPFDHLGPIQLFKNNGNSNHWIEIDLVGTTSNRDGIGARVFVTAGDKTQLREQAGGVHKDSQNHTRIHFGLGHNSTIQRLEVHWPSGIVQVIENISADQVLRVVESSGGPQPPVAGADSVSTDMDTATAVDVLVNDYDPNGDTLTITAVDNPTSEGGIAIINDNGSPSDPNDDFIDYTPPASFSGTDTFDYIIDDYTDGTGTATVTVTVNELEPVCIPYGEPNYDAATEDGVFLWKEGNVWHLRAIAGSSGGQRYSGSIVADMDFVSVTPVSLEQWGDSVDTPDSQLIEFNINMGSPWYDGLDIEVQAGATVFFNVEATSGNAADLVFIGGNRCTVDQLPYQLLSDSNTPPVAMFTVDPTLGEEPLEVHFDASAAYDPDGSIVSYAWNYGDGTGSGLTSNHTYNTPGTYNVVLTVTDNDGSTNTANQTIMVGTSSNCDPYGEPIYDAATEDGVFLWNEGVVWHLRAIAGSSGWQRYTGSIVSDMPFSSVIPVNLEPNDTLDTSNSQEIIFAAQMSRPWFDGIDFEVPTGATVQFDVRATSGNAADADLVFIGRNRCPVNQLPYSLVK
ncbi:FG-GAP-like repeat-containing protein [Desulfogranum marinum]|uniref:FG-GAP-like repeat-containing protein n=1 Tax=Desulfogranum marinum TaxID=453220 RepID=UPI0029C958B4|nr:FG-GAP-like repeat-containing protein [Desulfogranum marinum]